MTGEQLAAAVGGLVTLLTVGAGGAFAFVKWLVATLNASYKTQIDGTLTVKNYEMDLLRQDRDRWRDEAGRWKEEAERLRARIEGVHG